MNQTSTPCPRKKSLATAMQYGKSLGAASSGGSAGTTSDARLRLILGAVGSFRVSDFTMRLPIDWADTEGQIAGVFNQVIAQKSSGVTQIRPMMVT